MERMRFAVPIAVAWACAAAAQQVATRDGNVYFTAADGSRLQLTGEFRDLFPVLAPDARHVAFIRTGSTSPDGAFGEETTELCVVEVGPGEPPPRCASVIYREGEDPLAGAREPRWSPDSASVYFLADFSRTEAGLCRFDLASGKAAFLAPANRFVVLQAGRWRGLPVADLADGERRAYFVLSREGRRLERAGEIGERIEAVAARLER
jgi:hypothetical protein